MFFLNFKMLKTVINPATTLFRNAAFGSRSTSSRLALSSLYGRRTNFDGTQSVNANFSGGELSKILLSSGIGNLMRSYSSAGFTSAAKITPAVNFLDMVKDGTKTLKTNDVFSSAQRNKGWYNFSTTDSNVKILASPSRLGAILLEKRSFWKRAAFGLGQKISGTTFGARSKKIQALGGIFVLLAMSETPDADTAILADSPKEDPGKTLKVVASESSLVGVQSSRNKKNMSCLSIICAGIIEILAAILSVIVGFFGGIVAGIVSFFAMFLAGIALFFATVVVFITFCFLILSPVIAIGFCIQHPIVALVLFVLLSGTATCGYRAKPKCQYHWEKKTYEENGETTKDN